jgi:hypothetical protein
LVDDEEDLFISSLALRIKLLFSRPTAENPYVLGSAEGDTGDSRDVLQSELANGLASLLLVAGVNGDGSAAGDGGLVAGLGLGLGAVTHVLNGGLGDLVVREFFYPGARHGDCGRY